MKLLNQKRPISVYLFSVISIVTFVLFMVATLTELLPKELRTCSGSYIFPEISPGLLIVLAFELPIEITNIIVVIATASIVIVPVILLYTKRVKNTSGVIIVLQLIDSAFVIFLFDENISVMILHLLFRLAMILLCSNNILCYIKKPEFLPA